MVTRVEMVNRASLELGLGAVQAELPQNATRFAIYDGVVEDIISSHPWRHARRVRELARLTATPAHYWEYQFQCPGEMLGDPRAVYASADCRQPFTHWELGVDVDGGPARVLFANIERVWLRYIRRSEEVLWPGHFRDLITTAVKSRFALSLREDRVLAADLRQVAFGTPAEQARGGLFAKSAGIDTQSEPSQKLAGARSPLAEVRGAGSAFTAQKPWSWT